MASGLLLIDRQEIILDDDAFGRVAPLQAVDPPPVGARPVPPAVVQAAPKQQLPQAMAAPLEIFTDIITGPRQVPHRFLVRRRRPHRRQQPGAPQLDQFARVPPVRLDPLARFPRNQRGRHHVAVHARGRQPPLQRIAPRPRFIKHAHRPRRLALQPFHQPSNRIRLVRHRPRHRRRLVADQHRNVQILLVRIDYNVRDNVCHDRLPSSAALAPDWRQPAICRWLCPPWLSASRTTTLRWRAGHSILSAAKPPAP
jgi:hypothetical protein